MGYSYISFSEALISTGVGHDFSFLDSGQFPADVRIVRVDYNPSPVVGLRLILESSEYSQTMDEALSGPGRTLRAYTRDQYFEGLVKFVSYNPVEVMIVPLKTPLYVRMATNRK